MGRRSGFERAIVSSIGNFAAARGLPRRIATVYLSALVASIRVNVRWPSGREQSIHQVPVGQLVTLREPGPGQDDTGWADTDRYGPPASGGPSIAVGAPSLVSMGQVPVPAQVSMSSQPTRSDGEQRVSAHATVARYYIYLTMATWCTSCRSHLPQLRLLQEQLRAESVALVAIPADRLETREELLAYQQQLPCRFAVDIHDGERDAILEQSRVLTHSDALPATLVLRSDGHVIAAFSGVPTVSQVRRVLRDATGPER